MIASELTIRHKILIELHTASIRGHEGMHRTLTRIAAQFY